MVRPTMSHTTRILVSGGDGILAQALRPYFPLATYCSKSEMDVTNAGEVRRVFGQVRPEIFLHCAAITSHNAEPFAYVQGNIQGTVNVAAQAKKRGARIIYLSTDYLGARLESDGITPVNAYASSKYAGECVVGTLGNALVVRGSWYSRLELSHAAADAFTTKLPVARAAFYVATLATSSLTGVVNIAGPRRTIYSIALEFNERVIPVERSQIRCGYSYPADTSLDTTKLAAWLAA